MEVNGAPAVLICAGDQQVLATLRVADGRVAELPLVTNPDKLRYLNAQLDHRGRAEAPDIRLAPVPAEAGERPADHRLKWSQPAGPR